MNEKYGDLKYKASGHASVNGWPDAFLFLIELLQNRSGRSVITPSNSMSGTLVGSLCVHMRVRYPFLCRYSDSDFDNPLLKKLNERM